MGSAFVLSRIISTLARSLAYWDYYNQASQGLIQTRNETDIAGDYAILAALFKQDGDHPAAGALVWGKSPDKKLDILVAISARDATMDELVKSPNIT